MSPRRLAEIAIGRPRRVLAVWGVVVSFRAEYKEGEKERLRALVER